MPDSELGALAAALAKAQAAFPAITRDKEVTVTSKRTGSTYKFKYAPLDAIIAKTRGPLSDNGLAVAQLLDSDAEGLPALVTMLLHESGGSLTGRTPIPHSDNDTAQEFGSSITYLRRYAYTAMLGIATEDDDDGNRAAGNAVTFREPRPAPERLTRPVSDLIGTAAVGDAPADYNLREEPDGWALSFKLMDGRKGFRVVAKDELAQALALVKDEVVGATVSVWGTMGTESFVKAGKTINYNVVELAKISTPTFVLPADTEASDTTEAGEADPAVPTSPPEPETPSGGALCGAKGPDSIPGGAICTLEKDHPGRHRELATDGHSIASW